MTDALSRIITPIVEGQIRSYLHDHPEIAEAYAGKWRPKDEGVLRSISKRILTDLLCEQTRVRLTAAVLELTLTQPRKKRTMAWSLRSLCAGWNVQLPRAFLSTRTDR